VRFLSFVLVAAGLHVLLPLGARIAPRREALLVAHSSSERRVEIDIEDVLLEPPRPDEQRPDQPAVATNDAPRRPTDAVDPRNPDIPRPNVEVPEVLTAEPTPSAAPSTKPEEWTAPPPTGPVAGLGVPGLGTPVWAVPGVVPESTGGKPAPTTIAPPPAVDRNIAGKVVGDLMREKDSQLGLDLPGAGAIASVVSDVVRGSGTPDVARATLEVRIAPGGRVASVRVVRSSSGNAGDWTAVASSVSGRLASRQFALPSAYANGAVVMIEVVSKIQYPDGSTGGTKVGKGGSSDSLGGSMSFDASNIGARPKRHVAAYASARPAT